MLTHADSFYDLIDGGNSVLLCWYMEVLFAVLYATLIGFYNVFKKLAVTKTHGTVILVMFTTTAFACSLIWLPFGVAVPWHLVWILALKGFLIAISWFLVLRILKTVDLSIVTVTDVLSAGLSFVLGIVIFHEGTNLWQVIGAVIIVLGVVGINLCNRDSKGRTTMLQILGLIFSALVSVACSVFDKYTTTYLTPYQVQFWFLFFLCLFVWLFFIVECLCYKKVLIQKQDLKNFWIYLVGIFLFLGDFFLFQAYKVPGSKMIVISILSKLKVIIPVFMGILIFKEKHIWKKLLFTAIVISGAVLVSAF
ncbi:MAG: EamA family transporter [Clostridia bacterium]|nr:EamA family transporter [Clostridia bacterium]